MAANDYYKILELDKTASADDIKSAYRRLAKKYHPDLYAQKPEAERKSAETKFKEIQHAYDVLSDSNKRAAYDQYGDENGPTMGRGGAGGFSGFSGFSGFDGSGGDFGDIFSDIFSGFGGQRARRTQPNERAGDDIEIALNLTFKEAYFGVEKEITFKRIEKCKSCKGTGAKGGTAVKTCPKCKGSGTVIVNQRTIFGTMQSQVVCDMCKGTGKMIETPCPDCHGQGVVRGTRTLTIKVPAGIDSNQMLTLRGEGSASRGIGPNGNLTVIFKVAPHPLYRREGQNLYLEFPITVIQAITGGKVEIPTMNGIQSLDIPAGTQDGTVFRIKGRGMKSIRNSSYGDLLVKITVDIPSGLSLKQKKQLDDFATLFEGVRYDKIDKFRKSAKDV